MGMVLVAVAVQMFLTGIERYIGQLPEGRRSKCRSPLRRRLYR